MACSNLCIPKQLAETAYIHCALRYNSTPRSSAEGLHSIAEGRTAQNLYSHFIEETNSASCSGMGMHAQMVKIDRIVTELFRI